MHRTHLALLTGVVALSVAMCGLNLKLNRRNTQLKSQLDTQIQQEKDLNAPLPGWVMPPLKGRKHDGQEAEIRLQRSSPKITLLLFDPENCKICDRNWEFWNKLIADPDNGFRYLAVTSAPPVPEDYWAQHKVPKHSALFGLDPAMLKQMRMQATPQTIYMESGTIKKVWFGLLSDDDVKEISKDMEMED